MKPDFAIAEEHDQDGVIVVCVDTTQATYQGVKWLDMGDFGKRKFENFLFLSRQPARLKIRYV